MQRCSHHIVARVFGNRHTREIVEKEMTGVLPEGSGWSIGWFCIKIDGLMTKSEAEKVLSILQSVPCRDVEITKVSEV